jgi:nucleoid-associated protein YgaU
VDGSGRCFHVPRSSARAGSRQAAPGLTARCVRVDRAQHGLADGSDDVTKAPDEHHAHRGTHPAVTARALAAAALAVGAALVPVAAAPAKPPSTEPEAEAPSAPPPPPDEKKAERLDKKLERKRAESKKKQDRDRGQVKDDEHRSPPPAGAKGTPSKPAEPGATGEPAPSSPAPKAKVRARGSYTVRRGDSLWSIAVALAPGDAPVARIAALKNELWALNAAAIGTGDPDLIFAGQKLRLPA